MTLGRSFNNGYTFNFEQKPMNKFFKQLMGSLKKVDTFLFQDMTKQF